MSDAKPPSMTCNCLKDIVFGPASTIEALGRPNHPMQGVHVSFCFFLL